MPHSHRLALAVAGLAAAAALAGCGSSSGGNAAAAASSGLAQATANPTYAADLNQAKALIRRCATNPPGKPALTPLQEIHLVHVLFLERATGKHATEVTSTRARVFGCMGVPAGQRDNFKNDSITAAEHQKPHVWTKAGVKLYVLTTWPGILAKYQKTGAGGTMSPAVTPAPSSSGASQ